MLHFFKLLFKLILAPFRGITFFQICAWIILGWTLLITVFAWLTLKSFIGGTALSNYWLLIVYSQTSFQLPIVILGSLVFLPLLREVIKLIRRRRQRADYIYIRLLLAAFVFSLIAAFPAAASDFSHVDTIHIKHNVYHLAKNAPFLDLQYYVFRCDRFDLICHQFYQLRSQEASDSSYSYENDARLYFDPKNNQLIIKADLEIIGAQEVM